MNTRILCFWLLVLVWLVSPGYAENGNIPAFPGAEGFGSMSVGGRGGQVIEVTNLNDDGPGSLRAAVTAEGPRIVVFRVGGTIELRSELVLTEPYITIAGQTAPGGGITLKTHPDNPRSALTVKGGAHDVVIRYLRSRPGPSVRRNVPNDDSHIKDALQVLDAWRVVVDHCSFSWATDEVLSTWSSARDVTFQWCIISEGLLNRERGGVDGKGLLMGGPKAERISAHHNLLVHNIGRTPMVKGRGLMDVVNNVVLVPEFVAMSVDGEYGMTNVNLVGNVVIAPKADGLVHGVRVLGQKPVSLFVKDNIGPFRTKDRQPDELFVRTTNNSRDYVTPDRHAAPAVTTHSPEEAVRLVLEGAGCVRPGRDAVDKRILDDFRKRHCRLVNDPAEVGGWPFIPNGTPPEDTDHDGMPDAWESENGLDLADASDGPADSDGDGYTNVEEYLNSTDPDDPDNVSQINTIGVDHS